jgi:hypothetical protein
MDEIYWIKFSYYLLSRWADINVASSISGELSGLGGVGKVSMAAVIVFFRPTYFLR